MTAKLLFLTHNFYPHVGGIEVNSEILATAFHDAGYHVRMLTWTQDVGTKEFPFHIHRNPSLTEIWRSHEWADVVYHNNPCLRLGWPSLVVSRPVVVALRTWLETKSSERSWTGAVKRSYLSRAHAVIAVSDAVRKKCWPEAKVIPNPYRVDLFKTDVTQHEKIHFVFLGRLVSDKGADFAVRMMGRVLNYPDFKRLRIHPGFSMTIVGDGPEKLRLQELARELGILSKITFTGMLEGNELVSCLSKHKYIIIPSLWEEPFGNVALEGMACGCIPIVSDGGGLPQAVGDAGIVFKRGDLNGLCAAVINVLNDQTLEQKLRRAAHAHLANHHPQHVSQRYLEVIESAQKSYAR